MRSALRVAVLGGRSPTVTPLGPGIVTQVEILSDISIAITNPVSISVTMPTNGVAMKITTSGSAVHTALDISKIQVFCRTRGHDATGTQVWTLHTVGVRSKLLGPYNEKTVYQPVNGEFILVLDDYIFNQDATWKTEILSVYYAAGWLTGQPEGQFTASVTRSDTLAFFPFAERDLSIPWGDAIQTGGTYRFRLGAVNGWALAKSQVACVEAWLVDKNGLAGPETRISAMTLSDLTPGTEPGRPVPLYEGNLAITGLAQGLCHTRHRTKPWRGPPQESATYGQDMGEYLSPMKGVPVHLDLDASYVPLYGIIANDPTAATIANDTTVPVNVTGLSTTIAGAILSGQTYANEGTLFKAVQTVNNSGVNVTIADPVTGAATFSYKRTTAHNDCAGAKAVCRAVGGSTPGSNTGVYTLRTQMDTGFTPGNVAPEIRSETGTFSDDVRWRGVTTAGAQTFTWNVRTLPPRITLRGLYLDAVGLSGDTDCPVFSQYSSSDATHYTETTLACLTMIDCKVRGSLTSSQPETFGPLMFMSQMMAIRCDWSEVQARITWGFNWYSFGLYAAIGCKYSQSAFTLAEVASLFGCYMINFGIESQTTGNKPPIRGRLFVNVDQELTTLSGVTRVNVVAGGALGDTPQRDGEGWLNVLVRGTISGATNFTSWLIGGDATLNTMDGCVVHNCGANFPNQSEGSGRLNGCYNDSGYISVSKRLILKGTYFPGYNIKGDNFNTGNSGSAAPTHSTANAYFAGSIVKNGAGTLLYQALRDVPTTTVLTDTSYWFPSGNTPATVFSQQPRRQGNMPFRYMVGCSGVVSSSAQDGSTVPSATSWYGYAWTANSKYESARAGWFASASIPSASGELAARVPAGSAPAPFDLYGTVYDDNGSDYAGPVQA